MMPAIDTLNDSLNFSPEVMSLDEDGLILKCAHEMIANLETQIQGSRNLMEISNLKMHREVVNSMIEKFTSNHLKIS